MNRIAFVASFVPRQYVVPSILLLLLAVFVTLPARAFIRERVSSNLEAAPAVQPSPSAKAPGGNDHGINPVRSPLTAHITATLPARVSQEDPFAYLPNITVAIAVTPIQGPVGSVFTASVAVSRSTYTDAFRVDVYRKTTVDQPGRGNTGDNFFFVSAGGHSVTRDFQIRPSGEGSFTVSVAADTYDTVRETNEEDNTSQANYYVQALTLGGVITSAGGGGISGVTVTVTSASVRPTARSVLTNVFGRYEITGLKPARYVVTPARENYDFFPASRGVTLFTDTLDVNFSRKVNNAPADIVPWFNITPQISPLGTVLTVRIGVSISASTERGFWVDFYKNRTTVPRYKQQGDWYFFVKAGETSVVREYTFRPESTGTFQAWVQADTDGFVAESNENNNVAGPISYTVTAAGAFGLSATGVSASAMSAGEGAAETKWIVPPSDTMAAGMNDKVSWEVPGTGAVSHTYVVMSTSPDPLRNPLAVTPMQSGKPGVFSDWVSAPSDGIMYYQVVAIVDGRTTTSKVVGAHTP